MTDVFSLIEKISNKFLRVTRNNVAKFFSSMMNKHWKSYTDVNVEEVRKELELYSPKPIGHAVRERLKTDFNNFYDLSIIVPFYNTEEFAVRSIESIISQNTKYKIEIILIDDGSPDKCGEILDSYSHYNSVRVIHQANKGLSGARNAGIEVAQGTFIMFVDSDDLLCDNAVQELLDVAYRENADIVEGSQLIFNDAGIEKYCGHQYKKSTRGEGMFGFAFGKVIRSSLFDRICFPDQFYFEDTIISGLLYNLANTTVTIPKAVYKYYINQRGISIASRKKPKSIDTYYIIEELILSWKELNIPISNAMKVALIYQLSSYVYHRTKYLGNKVLFAQFILSCDLLKNNDLFPSNTEDYYVNEIIEALKNKQFKRWKYAAKYL